MMTATATYIPRNCSVVREDRAGVQQREDDDHPQPLDAFRGHASYVLLGAPGAGKTRAFQHEAQETGGTYVTARDFLTFGDLPEWHGTTLYIDGLDEQRAGANDQRSALDKVRAKLNALGRPRFRLSCREADWLGAHDRTNLAVVAPDATLVVLRLEPLTDAQACELLHGLDVADPRHFLAVARDYGVDGLAANPQTLELLARSVAYTGHMWPASRTEVFERGCRALARERNDEHQQADISPPSESAVLDAAGHLSAIWLLTGARGYTETANDGDELLPLGEIEPQQQSLLRATVRTALFDSQGGCFTPCHRHIAEFLGGRYLSSRVREVPLRRILTLFTGFDGGFVSELRGIAAWLAAWLAAHSQTARRELILRDPLGIVLYGDVRGFTTHDKQHLIRALEHMADYDPSSLTLARETDTRWGDLATYDMAREFESKLRTNTIGEAQEAVLVALLQGLSRGAPIPTVVPLLLNAVRDEERNIAIRELALLAYLKQSKENNQALTLLDEIHNAKVSDPGSRMLARLLLHLYPGELTATKLATYLEDLEVSTGALDDIWLNHVPRKSNAEQLEEFMDAIVESNKITPVQEYATATELHLRLPSRLLSELLHKDRADPHRIFEWLAFINPHHSAEADRIRKQLYEHPKTLKRFHWMHATEEKASDAPRRARWSWAWALSEGFGLWFAGKAAAVVDERIVEHFLTLAVDNIGSEPDWSDIAQRMHRRPDRLNLLRERWQLRQDARIPFKQPVDTRMEHMRRVWHTHVKAALPDLVANRCNAELLHQLARIYFGFVHGIDAEGARARLLNLLLGDVVLVDAVLDAFARTPDREDLPSARDIWRLSRDEQHFLGLPLLAGLEERADVGAAEDDTTLRLGLMILFNGSQRLEHCRWYLRTVASRPDLVAEALVKFSRRDFRQGLCAAASTVMRCLYDTYHGAVTCAAIPVLRAFPVRSPENRLPLLARLLRLGVRHHLGEMYTLVCRKLATRSMSVGQRMYWLCAGLLVCECEFAARMHTALTQNERRVRHVAAFFRDRDSAASPPVLSPETLGLLLRAVGSSYGPVFAGPGPAYIVTGEMETADLVRGWIDQLAGVPSETATRAFESLLENPDLSRWHRALRHAATAQREQRRNASFKYATMGQVLDTLAGGPPANAADLAALTDDVLAALAEDTRSGATSDWRQYWKTGLDEPEHEDDCRDRLLSDLGQLLSAYEVQAEPEGRYTDDKRADIKVLGAGAAVPIEIKKSNSPDLWTALRGQLVAKYVPDPKADGHGIYLVLWYGEKPPCKPDAEGRRPESAEELRSRLQAQLTEVESRRIFVRVIDVSNPRRETA